MAGSDGVRRAGRTPSARPCGLRVELKAGWPAVKACGPQAALVELKRSTGPGPAVELGAGVRPWPKHKERSNHPEL